MRLEHKFHILLYCGLFSFLGIVFSSFATGEFMRIHNLGLSIGTALLSVLFGYLLVFTTIGANRVYIEINYPLRGKVAP